MPASNEPLGMTEGTRYRTSKNNPQGMSQDTLGLPVGHVRAFKVRLQAAAMPCMCSLTKSSWGGTLLPVPSSCYRQRAFVDPLMFVETLECFERMVCEASQPAA